jgi:hypothetical protein
LKVKIAKIPASFLENSHYQQTKSSSPSTRAKKKLRTPSIVRGGNNSPKLSPPTIKILTDAEFVLKETKELMENRQLYHSPVNTNQHKGWKVRTRESGCGVINVASLLKENEWDSDRLQ